MRSARSSGPTRAAVLVSALSWGAELAKGAVITQGLVKKAVNEKLEHSLDPGLDLEAECLVDAFRTEDAKIGIKSFREKGPGKAEFVGKWPSPLP